MINGEVIGVSHFEKICVVVHKCATRPNDT